MMTYLVTVDNSIDWKEEFSTLDEAINTIRELVEVDKRYTFAGTTNFRFNSRGKDTTATMQVKWLYMGEDGKPHQMCKTIRRLGWTRADEYPEKYSRKNYGELWDKWEEIRQMFL